MANPPKSRKRVRPPCRAPNGSAFQNCNGCGASVAVVLMDMHKCQEKKDKDVKRLKGKCDENPVKKKDVKRLKAKCDEKSPAVVETKNYMEEPRSAFQFFLESYTKTCKGGDEIEINRKAFEEWKSMPIKYQWPHLLEAEKAEKAYMKLLRQEVEQMSQEYDDEADSAMVGKFDKQHYQEFQDYENNNWSEDDGDLGPDDWTVHF